MYTFCYKVLTLSPRRQIPNGLSVFSIFGIFRYYEYRRWCRYRYFKISDISSVFRYTDPRLIYNVDETGVPTVPTKLPKVLSAKGAKRVAKVVSSERGKTVTLVCSMNAVGNFIPPELSFPERHKIFWTMRLLSRLESPRRWAG